MITTGIVYKITNTVTKKEYIGQTTDFKDRMRQHKKANSKYQYLHSSIKEHGWDKFEVIKLHENVDLKDLEWLEKHCILIWNTLAPNGYNLKYGGSNGLQSEETKRKISKSLLKYHGSEEGIKTKQLVHSKIYNIWNDKESIVNKYKSGLSTKLIAKEYDCSIGLIRKILKEAGIQFKTGRPDLWNKSNIIVNEYKSGLSLGSLSRKYNCSHILIRNILLKEKVKLRDRNAYRCGRLGNATDC